MSKVQAAARELESATNTPRRTRRANDGVTAVRIEEPTFKWSDWLWQGSHGAIEFAGQMFAVLCLVYYLLAAGDLYKRKLVRMVPTLSNKKMTVEILAEIDRQIERFLIARIVISVIVGVAIWIALSPARARGGRRLGRAVGRAVRHTDRRADSDRGARPRSRRSCSSDRSGWRRPSAALGVLIGAIEGNVLTPWLMSRVGEMNAVAVFVSLLFWGWIWGVWGLLLAVPITGGDQGGLRAHPRFRGRRRTAQGVSRVVAPVIYALTGIYS